MSKPASGKKKIAINLNATLAALPAPAPPASPTATPSPPGGPPSTGAPPPSSAPRRDADSFVTGDRVQVLPLATITRDPRAQPRAQLEAPTVEAYREAMAGGEGGPGWGTFPPVVVFDDGSTRWLADGFHRLEAAQLAGLTEARAEVRAGGLREAVLYSVGANAKHGLPRTNADKRRAVLTLLADPEWSARSDRWIGQQVAVSHTFVANLRAEGARLATVASQPTRSGDWQPLPVEEGDPDSSPAASPSPSAEAFEPDHQTEPPALAVPAPTVRTGRDGRAIKTGKIGKGRPTASKGKATPATGTHPAGALELALPRALARELAAAGWSVRLVATWAGKGKPTDGQRQDARETVREWAREALGSGVRALQEPDSEE